MENQFEVFIRIPGHGGTRPAGSYSTLAEARSRVDAQVEKFASLGIVGTYGASIFWPDGSENHTRDSRAGGRQ